MVTPRSRLPFGKHKGKALRTLPSDYLRWMATNLRDSDFHEWAVEAEKLLKTIRAEEQQTADLEQRADQFLKSHGVNPNKP